MQTSWIQIWEQIVNFPFGGSHKKQDTDIVIRYITTTRPEYDCTEKSRPAKSSRSNKFLKSPRIHD